MKNRSREIMHSNNDITVEFNRRFDKFENAWFTLNLCFKDSEDLTKSLKDVLWLSQQKPWVLIHHHNGCNYLSMFSFCGYHSPSPGINVAAREN